MKIIKNKLQTHDKKLNKYFSLLNKFDSYCWIAGGFILDYFTCIEPREADIFFPSLKARDRALKRIKKMGGYQIDEFGNCLRVVHKRETYDLIFAGKKPELTLALFDYTICCAALDKNKNFFYHEKFLEHIDNKELHFIGNKWYNAQLEKRLKRYINEGYSIDNKNLKNWINELVDTRQKFYNKKRRR